MREYAAARGWECVGAAEWKELRSALPDVSEKILRTAGLPLEQPWRGVKQSDFNSLELSLRELGEIYSSHPDLASFCRATVITAKDHARLASRNRRQSEPKRAPKAEMVEWMLVWLGDPSVFPVWAEIRRVHLSSAKIKDCSST